MPVNGKLQKAEITALENSYLSFEGALEGYLLWNADEVLQTRAGGQGLRIYDRLFDDPHVQAVLNKLADAVISRDWIVAAGGDKRTDKRAADLVQTQLQNLNLYDLSETEENHTSVNGFDQVTRSLIISGRLNGYVCAEVMWTVRDELTVANDIRIRDPRQFGFMRGDNGYVLRHLTRENPFIGTPVDPRKVLTWSYGALDGSPYGRALGRSLFWPVFFKKNIIKFDLKFLERFASPKPTGKYPQGASPVQIDTLKKALSAIANETEIAIPEGMMIEYLEAASSGTVDAYERSLRYWDEQISECVLGETGTTNQSGGGGSRARDQVGNEVRLETSKAIADSLSCTFNRLARWIAAYNFPDAAPPTIYRDFGTAEDLNTRSTRDKTLFDLGYRLNAETVASVYGEGYVEAVAPDKPALIATLGVQGVSALTAILAQAESGQLPKENAIAVLTSVFGIDAKDAAAMVPEPPEQPAQQGGGLADLFGGQNGGNINSNDTGGNDGGNNPVDTGTAFSEDAADRPIVDTADQITDKVRPLIEAAIAPWLTTIQNFVEQASSLEEIRDGLIDLYPDLDGAAFAQAMGQAIMLADLAGREEVLGDDADVAFAEAIEAAVNATLDFATKASGGKKPNCNPAKSHFCQTPTGKGSCVSLSKKCKYTPKEEVKEAADWEAGKVEKTEPAFPNAKAKISEESLAKASLDPIIHDFYDHVKKGGKLSQEEKMLAENKLGVKSLSTWQKSKAKKLQEDSLDLLEAAAFENYIGTGYGDMNAAIYAPVQYQDEHSVKAWKAQIAINKAAVDGMKKIPIATEEDILKLVKIHKIDYTSGDPLIRHLGIDDPDQLKAYIDKHQSALDSGNPLIVEHFMSTTFSQQGLGYFKNNANIKIKVKAKLDGTGSGVLVDKYKNNAFESEVLYPPMTQFKVNKITVNPPEPEKKVKEIVPNLAKAIKITAAQAKLKIAYNKNLSYTGFIDNLTPANKKDIEKYLPKGIKLENIKDEVAFNKVLEHMNLLHEKAKNEKKTVIQSARPESYSIEIQEI